MKSYPLTNRGCFSLVDNIYLTKFDLYRLEQYNITSLNDLLETDEWMLAEILGRDLDHIEKVIVTSQILQSGKIPTYREINNFDIVYLGRLEDNLITELKIIDDGILFTYVNIKIDQLLAILENRTVFTIGSSWDKNIRVGIDWQEFLHDFVLLGSFNDHDYIHYKITGIRKNTAEKLFDLQRTLDFEQEAKDQIILQFHKEIVDILQVLVQEKQARRSSTLLSSVNNTANRPPKL